MRPGLWCLDDRRSVPYEDPPQRLETRDPDFGIPSGACREKRRLRGATPCILPTHGGRAPRMDVGATTTTC